MKRKRIDARRRLETARTARLAGRIRPLPNPAQAKFRIVARRARRATIPPRGWREAPSERVGEAARPNARRFRSPRIVPNFEPGEGERSLDFASSRRFKAGEARRRVASSTRRTESGAARTRLDAPSEARRATERRSEPEARRRAKATFQASGRQMGRRADDSTPSAAVRQGKGRRDGAAEPRLARTRLSEGSSARVDSAPRRGGDAARFRAAAFDVEERARRFRAEAPSGRSQGARQARGERKAPSSFATPSLASPRVFRSTSEPSRFYRLALQAQDASQTKVARRAPARLDPESAFRSSVAFLFASPVRRDASGGAPRLPSPSVRRRFVVRARREEGASRLPRLFVFESGRIAASRTRVEGGRGRLASVGEGRETTRTLRSRDAALRASVSARFGIRRGVAQGARLSGSEPPARTSGELRRQASPASRSAAFWAGSEFERVDVASPSPASPTGWSRAGAETTETFGVGESAPSGRRRFREPRAREGGAIREGGARAAFARGVGAESVASPASPAWGVGAESERREALIETLLRECRDALNLIARNQGRDLTLDA